MKPIGELEWIVLDSINIDTYVVTLENYMSIDIDAFLACLTHRASGSVCAWQKLNIANSVAQAMSSRVSLGGSTVACGGRDVAGQ